MNQTDYEVSIGAGLGTTGLILGCILGGPIGCIVGAAAGALLGAQAGNIAYQIDHPEAQNNSNVHYHPTQPYQDLGELQGLMMEMTMMPMIMQMMTSVVQSMNQSNSSKILNEIMPLVVVMMLINVI